MFTAASSMLLRSSLLIGRWRPIIHHRSIFLDSRSKRISLAEKKDLHHYYERAKQFAAIVRPARMLFLSGSIFYLGYNLGTHVVASNPQVFQKSVERHIIQSNMSQENKGMMASWNKWRNQARVSRVGHKIVNVAKSQVQQDYDEAYKNLAKSLDDNASHKEVKEAVSDCQEIQRCYKTGLDIQGDWKFQVLDDDSKQPEAFVCSELPRQVFINSTLLSKLDNDDELALILGHEVAHKMNQDEMDRVFLDSALRAFEVTLIGLDPTKGVWTMLFLPLVRRAIYSSEQRDQERAADSLGLTLAHLAGFDVKRGVEGFAKLNDFEQESLSFNLYPSFLSSHPPASQRYEDLAKCCNEGKLDVSKDSGERKTVGSFQALARQLHKWMRGQLA